MVDDTSRGGGHFFEHTQAGGGFSGVENFHAGSLHFGDESGGEGRDTAEALQEIESDAFAGEQFSRFATNARQFFTGGEAVATFFEQLHGIEEQRKKLDA